MNTAPQATRTIEIVISPTGEAVVTTRGFAGSSCLAASRFIEHALGQATAERLTSEFHLSLDARQDQHTGR